MTIILHDGERFGNGSGDLVVKISLSRTSAKLIGHAGTVTVVGHDFPGVARAIRARRNTQAMRNFV